MQKKIDNNQTNFWRTLLLMLPFVLIATLSAVLLAGGALLLFYSIVSCVAFKSAMIFLIVFGGGAIALGAGLLCIELFKKYRKFYNKKNGMQQKEQANVTQSFDKHKTLKDYITFENISLLVVMIGAICCIVSAALGCVQRDKWVQQTEQYYQEHEYYSDIRTISLQYPVDGSYDNDVPMKTITIDLNRKVAIIKYTDSNDGFVGVSGYESYKNQISIARSEHNEVLHITETQAPRHDDALSKLMFFLWSDNKYESQVIVSIPQALQGQIEIEGEYIIAQN